MAINATVLPQSLVDDSEDPEYFEFLAGRSIKKVSVGRRDHSKLGRIVAGMLLPVVEPFGGVVESEWTIVSVSGREKAIPDVTVSYPVFEERNGYLVAPAFLVVESLSPGQRLNSMVEKCVNTYHGWDIPYCWILDYVNENAYEVHRGADVAERRVDMLTAGTEIQIKVSDLYHALRGH